MLLNRLIRPKIILLNRKKLIELNVRNLGDSYRIDYDEDDKPKALSDVFTEYKTILDHEFGADSIKAPESLSLYDKIFNRDNVLFFDVGLSVILPLLHFIILEIMKRNKLYDLLKDFNYSSQSMNILQSVGYDDQEHYPVCHTRKFQDLMKYKNKFYLALALYYGFYLISLILIYIYSYKRPISCYKNQSFLWINDLSKCDSTYICHVLFVAFVSGSSFFNNHFNFTYNRSFTFISTLIFCFLIRNRPAVFFYV